MSRGQWIVDAASRIVVTSPAAADVWTIGVVVFSKQGHRGWMCPPSAPLRGQSQATHQCTGPSSLPRSDADDRLEEWSPEGSTVAQEG